MYLKELQKNWNTFGEEDAMWAVCSSPEKKHNKWKADEFFESGINTTNKLVAWIEANDYPKSRAAALDFGCGLGRLTQALCPHFDFCVGVDVAPSMIRQAKEFNQYGKKCVYRLNEAEDLSIFPDATFDLINTEHVLQHMHPQLALSYIAEFIRVLKPDGLAYIHCPSALATFAYPDNGISCRLDSQDDNLIMEHMSLARTQIRITNTGDHPIGMNKTINAPAKIWHHWHHNETKELSANHGYTNVPSAIIAPGKSVEFEYQAASPAVPGDYTLVLSPTDYFNEPAFKDENDLIAIKVEVTPRTTHSPKKDKKISDTNRPHSESHAIPVEIVSELIERNGGRIIKVKTHQDHPGSVVRTDYYVTR